MHDPLIPRVPDDWTVRAFSDPHGVASGLEAALVRAGLLDEDLRWSHPREPRWWDPATTSTGGLDSPRVVALLRRRGNPQLPPGARLMVTLVERAGEMALDAARRVVVATGHAPDRRRG